MSTPTIGKLEVTIKINELPVPTEVENGWKEFAIDCDGLLVTIKVRPKIWNKLEQASRDFPLWVAAIAGKPEQVTNKGFRINQPAVQVFEKKPKEAKPDEEK